MLSHYEFAAQSDVDELRRIVEFVDRVGVHLLANLSEYSFCDLEVVLFESNFDELDVDR